VSRAQNGGGIMTRRTSVGERVFFDVLHDAAERPPAFDELPTAAQNLLARVEAAERDARRAGVYPPTLFAALTQLAEQCAFEFALANRQLSALEDAVSELERRLAETQEQLKAIGRKAFWASKADG